MADYFAIRHSQFVIRNSQFAFSSQAVLPDRCEKIGAYHQEVYCNMTSSKPLKLLFVIPYVPNPVRVRPFQFIRALMQRGHEITLATLPVGDEEQARRAHHCTAHARLAFAFQQCSCAAFGHSIAGSL